MQAVIVSNAQNDALRKLTEQAIETSGIECIVVEQNPEVDYKCLTVHYDFPFNYNRCLNFGYSFTSENVAFCNNDLIFQEGWIGIEKHLDTYASVSPLNPGWMFHKGFEGKAQTIFEGFGIGVHVCGWCIITSRATIEKVGGFDEDVEFWMSDNLWSESLVFHGLKHALITDYKVRHLASRTLFNNPKDIGRLTKGQVPKFNEAVKKYR